MIKRRLITSVACLPALLFLCLGAIRIGPTILQRYTWDMLQTRTLAPGELSYCINTDGTASLRIGDGATSYGLPIVDTAAVRVSEQYLLSPTSEYYVELTGGVTANINQTYTFLTSAIAATGAIHIVSQDARKQISKVTFDTHVLADATLGNSSKARSYPSNDGLVDQATNSVAIIASDVPGSTETLIVSNISVYAWIDRSSIGSTNDFTQNTVLVPHAVNTASPTTLGQMQTWLANNEGKHWSIWPAIHNVFLGGHSIIFGGTKGWNMGPDTTGDFQITRDGLAVMKITGGTTTNAADAVRIIKAEFGPTGYFDLYVWTRSTPTRAPVIASLTNLSTSVWLPYAAYSNSYPSTVAVNSTNTYFIRCASPEASRFFKAFAELSGDTPPSMDVRTLKIDGYTIYLHTNGVVMWQ